MVKDSKYGSLEKKDTHALRERRKTAALNRFDEKVAAITTVDRRRLSKRIHSDIQKLFIGCRRPFEYQFKEGIVVHPARGEADVYMGSLARTVIRISSDSDNLFYPNCEFVARPFREGI